MDIELTETQQQLLTSARRFMESECPSSAVREAESSDTGFSMQLWRRMAELGWLGLPLPEAHGGSGLSTLDLVVLAKEMGRALCPSPYIPTVVLAGGAIAAAGSDAQKRSWLPQIVSGDAVIAFALQEGDAYYDPRGVKTKAIPAGDGYVIDGTKMFVEFAGAADRLLVVARTGDSVDDVTLFLIDGRAEGVTMTPHRTVARDRQYKVLLEGVRASQSDVLGPAGRAWPLLEPVVQRGVVALCAYMVGAAERIHEMATAFAKDRVQFDRPIGSFQAIQHYLAQTITEIVAADTITLYAAWALDQGLPARATVARAKAVAGDTFKQASAVGAQVHGGIGFNEDVDTTLFLRRGKQYQLAMGDTGYWEDVIAAELLDR